VSPDDDPDLEKKIQTLLSLLRESGSAVLAFSGGVDSTFLLKTMDLSGMRLLAVTGVSGTMPKADYERACDFVRTSGVAHLVITTDELSRLEFVRNAPDRCFHCKDELFGKLKDIARERQFGYVFDGTNADDLNDYRPGRDAARKHGIRSPLAECGFSKADIREASRSLGLSTWDQPSSPCLSSRFPYGHEITDVSLRRVESAEEYLRSLGLQVVRVRDHGDTARIEVSPEDMPILMEPGTRQLVIERFRMLGYTFVSLDLEGYRSGSMNRVLGLHQN